jgi:hypothetical protein
MPLPRDVPRKSRRALVRAYKAGGRLVLLGKPYGYDYKTVRRVLVEEGLTIKPTGSPRKPLVAPIAKILEWHQSGDSCRQIALRLGTYPNKIADTLRDAGHEPNDGRCRRGRANPITGTGRLVGPQGYITVLLEPHDYWLKGTRGGNTMLEHRYLMARNLGRPLLRSETVHHKNGDKSDNRLVKGHEFRCPGSCCNLELWSGDQPPGQRVADKIVHYRKFLKFWGAL